MHKQERDIDILLGTNNPVSNHLSTIYYFFYNYMAKTLINLNSILDYSHNPI